MKKLALALLITAFFGAPFNGIASVQDEIAARNKQIEEIQQQIDAYQQQINLTSSKAKTLNVEISRLNAIIGKIQLEIKGLSLQITQTDSEINNAKQDIQETLVQIDVQKQALSQALLELYQIDQENLTEVLLKYSQLSDFFNNVKTVDDAQNTLASSILALKALKADLEKKNNDLQDKKSELQQLKTFQESQKNNLDQSKSTKNKILKDTKGEEAKYQQLVKESKNQINRIRDQIYYLQQQGLTVEDVIKYGKLAAIKTGIRPAFLIAILEVESRLGKNVGTGNWNDDMYQCYLRLAKVYTSKAAYYTKRAETEKTAYFKIVESLGIDPNSVKVSKEPSYGCGGAMGPAQFIPSTWLAYTAEVSANTGHNPASPWNIEDAFTAASIKLARGGAANGTRTGEIKAAKAYISGNANCTSAICNYYANLALDKAAIIEQNL